MSCWALLLDPTLACPLPLHPPALPTRPCPSQAEALLTKTTSNLSAAAGGGAQVLAAGTIRIVPEGRAKTLDDLPTSIAVLHHGMPSDIRWGLGGGGEA